MVVSVQSFPAFLKLSRYLGDGLVALPQLGRPVVGGGQDPPTLNTDTRHMT